MNKNVKQNLDFFYSICAVHASMNILDHTKLGHELFWRLLKACAQKDCVLYVKHINADGFAAVSAVRRVVRSLESDGWVVVETHPDDVRARVVKATPKLIEHATKCYVKFEQVLEEYMGGLNPQEVLVH